MTVDYSKVPGAAGYEISVSPNTGFSKSSTKRWETAAGGKTLTGLKKNTVYYVRIRAYRWDSAGRKVYGTYSSKTKGYTVKYRLNKRQKQQCEYDQLLQYKSAVEKSLSERVSV